MRRLGQALGDFTDELASVDHPAGRLPGGDSSSSAGGGVDHKLVEQHITELLGLCQLAEEYNQVGGL
jgi:hypothetical protein